MNHFLSRLWLFLLIAATVVSLLAMTFNVWPGIPVRSNIMQLLPALREDTVVRAALERNNSTLSRKLVVLISAHDRQQTDVATAWLLAQMQQQSFFDKPFSGVSTEEEKKVGHFFYDWRYVLLSREEQRLLENKNRDALDSHLIQTLYSPVSGINATLLENDPLLTFYDFMRSLPMQAGRVKTDDRGALVVHDATRDYRVIIVDIKCDVFDMDFHPVYEQWRHDVINHINTHFPDSQLLIAGVVEHAVHGANSAKHEVNTIGNGSLLGIITLIVLVFPGWRPLLISLLPLGAGMLAGVLTTIVCFGDIHLITLVFGSSVIGVAMDYSLHYMSDHYKSSMHDTPSFCMKRIFPGITFAMITSAIAYAAIGVAPFPVLRQIAVFSCVGLVMAWFSVVSLYPRILPIAQFRQAWFLQASGNVDRWLRHLFDTAYSRILLMILALAMLPGIWHLHANDDMRQLQAPDKDILTMENRVQTLTGFEASSRFFLIEGKTLEELLQRCEQLGAWQEQHHDLQLDLITRYLPSQRQQLENFQLQQTLYISSTNTFAQHWQQEIGLPNTVIEQQSHMFSKAPEHFLTLKDFMQASDNTALQRMISHYQLEQTERGYIVTVPVTRSDDDALLRDYAAHHVGVHWMDVVSEISDLFRNYRQRTGWMMLLAYSVIGLLLCWRYPLTVALRVLIAPVLAAWLTLGVLGYTGVSLNLFHVLALLLVLGVGIDYSIFFAESDEHRDTTMLAVILSTITTLLSFGLLALSKTAAISSFGIVVSMGIVCSLLFSPLARYHSQSSYTD